MVRRTAVTDAQASLQQRVTLFRLEDQAHGIVEQGVILVLLTAAAFPS